MTLLGTRERMATAIACALIRSSAQADPMARIAVSDVAEAAATITDRLIDKCARDHAAHVHAIASQKMIQP